MYMCVCARVNVLYMWEFVSVQMSYFGCICICIRIGMCVLSVVHVCICVPSCIYMFAYLF